MTCLRCSSGVLLSPASADGLGASTILVSRADVGSLPTTPNRAPAPQRRLTADGSEAGTEQEWQLL